MSAKRKKTRPKVTAKTAKQELLSYEECGETDSSEFILDEITGRKRKSSPMHVLNKKKVNRFEMDELFTGDEW